MSDVDGRRNVRDGESSVADGLRGSPKETVTERSGVEASGFKSHPRRFLTNPLGSGASVKHARSSREASPRTLPKLLASAPSMCRCENEKRRYLKSS